LNELWECASKDYSSGDVYVYLDGFVLTRLIIDLLDEAGGERYPSLIENDCGPGRSSALILYHAKNPAKVLDKALAKLKARLKAKPKKARSCDPIPFAATSQPREKSMKRKATCQEIMAEWEMLGIPALPPDHPIYSEGPTITFLSHAQAQSRVRYTDPQQSDSPESGNSLNKG